MRDQKIDTLRFIGLTMIILAHAGTSGVVFQARNFDVPLMVIVSALSFRLTYKDASYIEYMGRRLIRLVLPAWIFLSLFFLLVWVIEGRDSGIELDTIVESYLLLDGIGYVWVLRVFLLVAVAAPFLSSFSRKIGSNLHFSLIVVLLLVGNDAIIYVAQTQQEIARTFIAEKVLLYLIPYSLIFLIGHRIPAYSRREIWIAAMFFGLLFLIAFVALYITHHKIIPTQLYKYPPRLYYISYALCISLVAWNSGDLIVQFFRRLKIYRVVSFASSNSIWIYLWHIPMIRYINANPIVKFFAAFLIASALTYIQVWLVRNILVSHLRSASSKRNALLILTG